MTCNHDPLYRINNESAGGAGCPICKAQGKRLVVVAVDTAEKCETVYDKAWFQQVIDARNDEARDEATSGPKTASLPQLTGTATVVNDWRTFITRCNNTDQRSMNADKGEDHE